jgi:CRISPR-associated protein Cmr2
MSEQYFHFTLGPVQGFVSQARRTRDFWAGSFLLSWLSAIAMQAVIKQKGEIVFPKVSEDYLNWLEGRGKIGSEPQQGCVPNRFKGGIAKVPADFDAKLVTASIQAAWRGLAEQVWKQDLTHCHADTREVWDRQIENFWEISWALSGDLQSTDLLDRRKNWRNYLPPEEAGVKCMMMDGWQELSSISTPNTKGLDLFWKTVAQKGGAAITTDLRPHEYLCAIAFVKRRFSHCFANLKIEMPNNWVLKGWRVKSSVPSISYIAAAPWLAHVLDHAPEVELRTFHDAAKQLTQNYGEYNTRLSCIERVLAEQDKSKLFWNTKSLDGNVFYETALDNKNIYPDRKQAQVVKRALKELRKKVNTIAPVSPFYAVLRMDGDSLGSQMSDEKKQEKISEGLDKFTRGVQAIVEEHSGFLIYAGGDDVLALLPLEFALNCANALRTHYMGSFDSSISTSLSGAIEYAHIKMPLGKILGDAHHLLDEIAKEQTGRDAIAVRVWKPGGEHLQWAMPWKYALNEQGQVSIQTLADDFQQDQQETPFSNSFFFKIEEHFISLQSKDKQGNQRLNEAFSKDIMLQLIAAEYLSSGVNAVKKEQRINLSQALKRVAPLLEQCFSIKRTPPDTGKGEMEACFEESQRLNVKALQFIRFLAQKGVDHG